VGISSLILLLGSIFHFSFATANEELLRSELRNHPQLFSEEAEIFSFLQNIKSDSYSIALEFKPTNSAENDFETIYYYESKREKFQWNLDAPSTKGGNCGYLSHLHLIENKSKIHYGTIFLKDDCKPIGISFYKNKVIEHIDLVSGSREIIDPNPKLVKNTEPVYFSDENFSEDQFAVSNEVRICVVDNGFNVSHAGLQPRIATDQTGNLLTLDLTDSDQNVYTDSPHGTHVAGIASKNSQKIKIVAVKLTTSDNSRLGNIWRTDKDIHDNVLTEIRQALQFCSDNQAKIVNLSLVYGESTIDLVDEEEVEKTRIWSEEYAAILESFPDLLYVVAAGNRGISLDDAVVFPAGLPLPNLITVGAYDTYTNSLWFEEENHGSNYSPDKVDILAPGVFISSFVMNSDFDSFTGTSMASPFVANQLAKIKLTNPNLSPNELKSRLLAQALQVDALAMQTRGGLVLGLPSGNIANKLDE
jgi:PAS domain-containing protein